MSPLPAHAAATPATAAIDTAALLAQLMHALPFGVAIFDEDDRAVVANAAGEAALDQAGWWACDRQHSCGEGAAWRWRVALVDARERGRRRLLVGVGGAALFIALSPLPLGGRRLVLATVGRGQLCGALELQLFATAHGLSNAEALVLAKLAAGLRPGAIARSHGVAASTVCTQVAAIRGKTASDSVQSLLLTLSRLPPVRPALA